jgi:hypothetical protein
VFLIEKSFHTLETYPGMLCMDRTADHSHACGPLAASYVPAVVSSTSGVCFLCYSY